MNISNATPIAPAVQLPVINQEAKVRAENAFPRAEEIDTSAQLPQTPDQSRQKANLEASAWRASQANISAQAETKKGSDGLANYTDLPPQRSQQAAEAYKAIEKPEQQVSVDAIV
ncbi:MAG: hypothetical protein QMC71_08625 [Gammaproteobacteria bacterium]|jgi:hypothetical protein|tara:strand:+ start:212 stop:556 length:345 start_codon:yes stop_codon:yes gene_type:complete